MAGRIYFKYWVPMMAWALLTVALIGTRWFDNEAMYGLIHADAQGYYGYLVAGLLEHTFNWDQVLASYADYHGGTPADFTRETPFGRVNKYYVGTAILLLPFFLLGCLHAWLVGAPIDGYSVPFHLWAMVGAIFYVGVGMVLLTKFLERKGISPRIAQFVSITCFFATGLFHYTVSEPVMSHAYSFFLFCLFLFAIQRFASSHSGSWLLTTAVTLALIVLVRPSNGLILLAAPFAVDGMEKLKSTLASLRIREVAFASGVALVVLGIQPLMYWLQVGEPVVWSYEGETFDFTHPEMANVLFSYRKGLFVYTPWAALGALGLLLALFKRTFEAVSALVFLAISVYVISSWWNWYYGSSLGMRALIEYMPFFAYGLAMLIQHLPKAIAVLVVMLTLATVPVSLIQNYQYQKFILHWDGMDKERFWKVFLKTDRRYDGIFYRQEKRVELPAADAVMETHVFETDFEEDGNWGPQGINSDKAHSGLRSTHVSPTSQFGSTLGVPVGDLGPAASQKKLLIKAWVWADEAFPDLAIAYSYRSAEGDYGHEYIGIGQYITEPDQWLLVEHLVDLGSARDTTHDWIVYPIMTGKGQVYLDDLRYEVISLK